MSADTKTRTLADLPHVNLLPPEISERKRLRQIQVGGAALVALVIAGLVGAYVAEGGSVAQAKKRVTTANAESVTLTQKVASFSTLRTVQADRDAHEAMLTRAMSTEIIWSSYLSSFATLPTSTWLRGITLSEAVGPGTLASPTAAPPVVATASFSGAGLNYISLADWLDRVAKLGDRGDLTNVYFSTAAEVFIDATKTITFAGTSNLSAVALSGRCAKPGVC